MVWHRSHLLRKGRMSEPGRAYLVTTITHGRARFFADWRVGSIVVRHLERAPAESLAWVVMLDHVHWLPVLQDTTLAEVMREMKSRSALEINRRLGRSGAVWQKDYYDHALRDDEDLRVVARYVVGNPLRAGLVADVGDYPLWNAVWL